jgi:hypothetical protein
MRLGEYRHVSTRDIVSAQWAIVDFLPAERAGSDLGHSFRGHKEIHRRGVTRTGIEGCEFECAAAVEVVTEARSAQVQTNQRG